MSEFLQVRSNGQITPCFFPSEGKTEGGRVAAVLVEEDGSIRLVPKSPVDHALAEKYQLADIDWAVKQKGKKK